MRLSIILAVILSLPRGLQAASPSQLVLPEQRNAYYSAEPIKLAVAGLAKDAPTVELVPQDASLRTVSIPVKGDGSTVTLVLPPGSLAPAAYAVKLEGKEAARLTISSGTLDSTFLASQTIGWEELKRAGANYVLGNAFCFGKPGPAGAGPETKTLRGSRSVGLDAFDRAVAMNLPTIVYMYWTGYCVHKPFGSEKSWGSADMTAALRLLSFHTAQRLRRYEKNIVCVGTLDEPGLNWGKTAGGGSASGFPNWDETEWYNGRGWQFTADPGSRPDDDWMRYMAIRCSILREQNAQAAKDLRVVWPGMAFSTDLYAPHAIMDGTDPLNQQVNDFPCSHVFVDWGLDRLGAYSGVMLEKAHDPMSKMAHAMNGQLFAKTVPQPGQLYAYRAAMNGMLAAGLRSNWWLNTGGMKPEDLAKVNGPAKRLGPLLQNMTLAGHDVAVLWSFAEIAMREKEMAVKEARKKPGEQIKIKVDGLPENTAIKTKEIEINAYSVGQDYKEAVQTAHYALARAGYPAHILHERLLPGGMLKNYKTLVIVGQTFALPADVKTAIDAFVAAGGRVVVDQSTRLKFDGAIVAPISLSGLSHRWGAVFTEDAKHFKTPKEASYYQTNFFMDEQVRRAVPALRQAMKQTASQARMETDSDELLVECHTGGEGLLYMVASGYEKLPDIAAKDEHWIYNYAPYRAKFMLRGLPEKCVVYCIEGGDWSKVTKVADPKAQIDGSFEPAEMKLYLVAPREVNALDCGAGVSPAQGSSRDGRATMSEIRVTSALRGLKMPWPLVVTITDSNGKTLHEVYRATDGQGRYQEQFGIGLNSPPGTYRVRVATAARNLVAQADMQYHPSVASARVLADRVQVFDAPAVQAFLKGKPEVVIAIGSDSHKAAAEGIAAGLAAKGVRATVKPESQVLRRARYPRVWDPSVKVYHADGSEQSLAGKKVARRIALTAEPDGRVSARAEDGKDLMPDWRQPESLVTIGGSGYVDFSGDREVCYEPGVKLYVDAQRQLSVVKGRATEERTTEEFKNRWSRPWSQLTSHVGAFQLPPQLPEAYTADSHLVLLGDSTTSQAMAALQASDLPLEIADAVYPGPGKALVGFAWSPFAVEKNVIFIGAADAEGLAAGAERLLGLVP